MEGILVPIAFFVFLGAVIVVPIWLRERTKQSAYKLISEALAQGKELDPVLIERLTQAPARKPQDNARRTLGSGVVLVALAAGFTAASYFSGDLDPSGGAAGGMTTAAIILGVLGIAFLILAAVDYAAKKKSDA